MSIDKRFWCYLVLLASPLVHGSVINGDFTQGADGLAGWATSGDVEVVSAEAVVHDNAADPINFFSQLWQVVELDPRRYQLSFDFNWTDFANPIVGSNDIFAATLYFTNDPTNFDLFNFVGIDGNLDLFDIDPFGLTPINGSGRDLGNGWTRWTVAFDNSFLASVPSFELFDGNVIADSNILIDNVIIDPAAIPLPSSMLLLIAGLIAMHGCRRKNGPEQARIEQDFRTTGWG